MKGKRVKWDEEGKEPMFSFELNDAARLFRMQAGGREKGRRSRKS